MATQEYSPEQIEQWRSQLEELAKQPRTVFSKKQAVEALIEPIQEALSVHSYEEVARQLKSWGLEITAGSLKQYVTRYRREQTSSTKMANKVKRKHSGSVTTQENQPEVSPEQPREQTSEFKQATSMNLSSPEYSGDGVVVQFEKGSDTSDPDEQLLTNTTAWAEPTFNRNRVRPQRISS